MSTSKISVTQVFRRKDPAFFSIERVFEVLEKDLENKVDLRKVSVPRYGISLRNVLAISSFFNKARKSDVYHITGHIHYAVFAFPRGKCVLTIHDCVFLNNTTGWRRWVFKKLLLDWPVRRAALVTAISESTRREVLGYTRCNPDKIMVIPNPVNEAITYVPRDFQDPVILFIGVTANKNLLRVIPALKDMPVRLHVIGKIPPDAQLLLQQHGIRYDSSAHLTDEELAARYADADLVLFPSTYEGFGLPIVEAQKAGRPVITSDLSPMKEVAGGAACLVDPYSIDSIRAGVQRVIADRSYREELVEKGFRNVTQYDKTAIAGQYLLCYKKISRSTCAE